MAAMKMNKRFMIKWFMFVFVNVLFEQLLDAAKRRKLQRYIKKLQIVTFFLTL